LSAELTKTHSFRLFFAILPTGYYRLNALITTRWRLWYLGCIYRWKGEECRNSVCQFDL